MVIRRKSDKDANHIKECRYHEQFLNDRDNQNLHEQRQFEDLNHDLQPCWCCCGDCIDLAWLYLPRKGVWWERTPNGELRMTRGSWPASRGSAETNPS